MALNSKRMQTFFNEFLISTTTFLNQFMTDCETKFFEFERKLNRIESNLVIIEAKLASVPLESDTTSTIPVSPKQPIEIDTKPLEETPTIESKIDQINPQTEHQQPSSQPTEAVNVPEPEDKNLIKISESFLYKKYFKMLKFGVPEPGVRVKMLSEGLDGNLLADPNLMIERCPEDDEDFEEE